MVRVRWWGILCDDHKVSQHRGIDLSILVAMQVHMLTCRHTHTHTPLVREPGLLRARLDSSAASNNSNSM